MWIKPHSLFPNIRLDAQVLLEYQKHVFAIIWPLMLSIFSNTYYVSCNALFIEQLFTESSHQTSAYDFVWVRDKVLALLCLSFKHSCDCDLWSVSRSKRGRVLEQCALFFGDTVEYVS